MRAAAVLTGIIMLWPGFARATDGEICQDIAVAINHPAQVVAEKVQQCFKGGFWKIVTAPHCCTPVWIVHPECYIVQQKNISDAWTEIRSETHCDVVDIAKNFKIALQAFFDPKTFLFKSLAPFVTDLKNQIDITFVGASPIPDDVKQMLEQYIADGVSIPYDKNIVERARWISSDDPLAEWYSPSTYQVEDSITWGDLIIAGPNLRNYKSCKRLKLWAHELTHVRQYKDKGFEKFLADYLDEVRQGKEYTQISAEVEAIAVENLVEGVCNGREYAAALQQLPKDTGPVVGADDKGPAGPPNSKKGLPAVDMFDERSKLMWCMGANVEFDNCSAAWAQYMEKQLFKPQKLSKPVLAPLSPWSDPHAFTSSHGLGVADKPGGLDAAAKVQSEIQQQLKGQAKQ